MLWKTKAIVDEYDDYIPLKILLFLVNHMFHIIKWSMLPTIFYIKFKKFTLSTSINFVGISKNPYQIITVQRKSSNWWVIVATSLT